MPGTPQQAAEAEVRRFKSHLGPFVVAAETTRMPMIFTDATEPGEPVIFANDAFLKLSGHTREEILGREFNSILAPDQDANLAQIEAIDGQGEVHCQRKDGSVFWASVFTNPVNDLQGRLIQHFTSFVDLTKHKDEEARSQMLIGELSHRVKNTLATVQAIVSQSLRSVEAPETIRALIESRLFALSSSHELLTAQEWRHADLRNLVVEVLRPFIVGREGRLIIGCEEVSLSPSCALALGIVFHELATNAIKYGSLSTPSGSVSVDWATDDGRLLLRWREQGGPPVKPPSHRGFGSWVIERGLAHETKAEVTMDYRETGLVCTMNLPFASEQK